MSEIVPSGNDDKTPVADDHKKDTVAYETFQKALSEKKLAQSKFAESESIVSQMQSKIDAYALRDRQMEEEKLNEQGEHQKVIEIRNQELAEARAMIAESKANEVSARENLQDTWKLQAFYEQLPGKIKNQEYLSFVDLNSIVFYPDTNRVDETSVKDSVSKFMEKHRDLVTTSNNIRLPNDAPNAHSRKYTLEEWKSLPMKEKKENWANRPPI